jgi:hypothetical protein
VFLIFTFIEPPFHKLGGAVYNNHKLLSIVYLNYYLNEREAVLTPYSLWIVRTEVGYKAQENCAHASKQGFKSMTMEGCRALQARGQVAVFSGALFKAGQLVT